MEDLANVDLYQPSPYVYMQKVQNAASIAVASTDFKEGDTLPKPQLSAAFGASVDIITLFGFSFQKISFFFSFFFFLFSTLSSVPDCIRLAIESLHPCMPTQSTTMTCDSRWSQSYNTFFSAL